MRKGASIEARADDNTPYDFRQFFKFKEAGHKARYQQTLLNPSHPALDAW
jgi:hypothetical protein